MALDGSKPIRFRRYKDICCEFMKPLLPEKFCTAVVRKISAGGGFATWVWLSNGRQSNFPERAEPWLYGSGIYTVLALCENFSLNIDNEVKL